MKPYPKYKSSGVPWLGDVPEHWDVVALKRRLSIANGSTPKSDEPSYWDGPIQWITPEDLGKVAGKRIWETKRTLTGEGYSSCGTQLVPEGSIVLSTRAPIGSIAIAGVEACTNQGCRALVPTDKVVSGFTYYSLVALTEPLQAHGRGTTFLELSGGDLSAFHLPFPSPGEQLDIAAYLDTETARIDTLVSEKEKLIGLLSEARMSTITRLIVGADLPGVPSGNPWVPHLPQGWQLKRLKHLADVRSGLAKGKDYGGKPTVKMPYLRVANVQDGHLNLTEVLTIDVAADEAERFLLQSGDVLMNEGGDYDKLGRGAVWTGEVSPCLHQNHVFAVRPYEEGVSEWLAATTQTRNAKFYFKSNAKQSTNLASINQTNVKELPVLLPPPKERQQLLSQLRTEVLKIDGLIAHVQQEIELLRELRSATITDAVLGRIDLRDYTKKNKQDLASELQPAL